MNIVVLIFSILISLGCFWFGFKFIKIYFKVKKWERVNATVVSKKAEPHKKNSTGRSRYGVLVDYKYNYNNVDYVNNKVYLIELLGGQANHMESSAKKIVDKIEHTISIYVNQQNPQESVIFCDGILLYVFIIIMGIGSLLMGLSS